MVTLKITRKPARRWVTISLDPGAHCTCTKSYTYAGTLVVVRNLYCQTHSPKP